MIRNVSKLLRKKKQKNTAMQDLTKEPNTNNFLNKSFHLNIETLHSIYNHCSDVIFREFIMFGNKKAAIIYIEGLSDVEGIEKSVLLPLMQESSSPLWTVNEILNEKLFISKWEIVQTFEKCIESISTGNPILLLEDEDSGISLGLSKWDKRSIEEPQAEGSIRGPREGFVESIGINTSLIRRIIKSPSLKIQTLKVGTYTNTSVAIVYIEGIIDQTLIEELNNRIKRIKIDGILESEYIEELIEDNPYSPFPQILSTERPDIVCANLLEGRFAVLIDGTPFCLIAPISFFSLIQSQEDYYQRFIISTFIRWLRYLFLGASLLFPSFYVAITTFHQEMVPTALLLSVAAARENVPFPAFVEVLLMEITFEALREAGIRLPKQVGAAVSIVGALVIGQAAVQAGLVSAPMVIVVAITGIASFMIPRYISGIAIRIIRFPIIFLAGTLGLLGIMMSILAILIHLSTLRSFGEPYLAPLAPLKPKELKDLLWRAPLWKMDTRPHLTGETNTYRQIQGQKPGPDKGEN